MWMFYTESSTYSRQEPQVERKGTTMVKFRLRKLLRKLMAKFLPQTMLYRFYRSFLVLGEAPPKNLTFKLARTREELEAAYKLLHDNYVKEGLQDPHPSGLRISKWHALPSTSTLVAIWDGEVVGTVSLIRRSAFGLPLEKIFTLTSLVESGDRVLEISALAIREDFSGKRGIILAPMCKYLFEYTKKYFGTQFFAITVDPKWWQFYEAIALFKPLEGGIAKPYSMVKETMAVAGTMNLQDFAVESARIYGRMRPTRNVHDFIFKRTISNFEFPDRSYAKISDPVLTPDLLDYFFNQKTQTLAQLSEADLFSLHQLYQEPAFKQVLPSLKSHQRHWKSRAQPRFEVRSTAYLKSATGTQIPVTLSDVAQNGICLVIGRPLREHEVYELSAELGAGQVAILKVRKKWSSENDKLVGLQVVESSEIWSRYIRYLEEDLFGQARLAA
jgi:hypothetical protein